ncbi:hypothetical protein IPJ72_03450 [Candidatus Peregrinibacteria bacterium]|nr:MAG: hypothetical protein IPJ72_03450 [Candidatus Peregrinibacteria bacterium]
MQESVLINEIKKLIIEKELQGESGAYKKFEEYVKYIKKTLGCYEAKKWRKDWRENIYEFGRLFEKNDAGEFIKILSKEFQDEDESNEVIEFVKSEIIANYFSMDSSFATDYFESIVKKYPTNPEFHYTYSHYLNKSGNYKKAIDECRIAVKIEPSNNDFGNTSFNREKTYFDVQILNGKILEAENQLQEMRNFDHYGSNMIFNNIMVALGDRLNDHKIIEKKIAQIDGIITEKTEEERRKLIEVIGIFVAIMGFIFTNVNIVLKNLVVKEMMLLMLEMALIFLIFGISISYIFQKEKKTFYKEAKFWILILLLSAIVAGIHLA